MLKPALLWSWLTLAVFKAQGKAQSLLISVFNEKLVVNEKILLSYSRVVFAPRAFRHG